MGEQSRSQKAAETLKNKDPDHFPKIGAIGGSKTPGTFQTKRGLARKAGRRSGLVRKSKALQKQIDNIRLEYEDLGTIDKASALDEINQLEQEIKQIDDELKGTYSVEGQEYIQ